VISFCLGAGSESGDFEALVEVDGIERRPERRGSLGESGGPIVAACAIIAKDPDNEEMKFREDNPMAMVQQNTLGPPGFTVYGHADRTRHVPHSHDASDFPPHSARYLTPPHTHTVYFLRDLNTYQ
jgi:hypothetical protein